MFDLTSSPFSYRSTLITYQELLSGNFEVQVLTKSTYSENDDFITQFCKCQFLKNTNEYIGHKTFE
jgi:hypothetical protein